MKSWIIAAALLTLASAAHADDCIALAGPKGAIAEHDGRWIELDRDQWEFLRGVSVLHPKTGEGIPPGDRAVLAQVPNDEGGVVFFIDGDKACSPMPIPKELIDLIMKVGADDLRHAGDGL